MKLFNCKIELSTKKRAPKGNGRAVKFKQLLLPENIIEELKAYKDEYSLAYSTEKDKNGTPIPAKVSFEQMFRAWLDSIRLLDPVIYSRVQKRMKKQSLSDVHNYEINPFDYPLSEFKYYFKTEEGEFEAELRDSTFYCVAPGTDCHNLSLDEMYGMSCNLINNVGYEFTEEDAHEVARRLSVVRYDLIKCIDSYISKNHLDNLSIEGALLAIQECHDINHEDFFNLILKGGLGDSAIFTAGIWTIRHSVFDWE